MQDPLKQGLKLISGGTPARSWNIRMQDPLKQGLKLQLHIMYFDIASKIRMQDPLKQGLKPKLKTTKEVFEAKFECKIH